MLTDIYAGQCQEHSFAYLPSTYQCDLETEHKRDVMKKIWYFNIAYGGDGESIVRVYYITTLLHCSGNDHHHFFSRAKYVHDPNLI